MTVLDALRATSAPAPPPLIGSTTPRLSTAPLVSGPSGPCGCSCALTAATSLGFEAVAFAETVLGETLLPWQRWWLIHALELRVNGEFRYRTVLTLVARQQGKTHLLKIVSLWAMYMGRSSLVLGVAQSLDIARESWEGAVALADANDDLRAEITAIRRTNGEQTLTLANGSRYRIAASSRGAGRGLSVTTLILDELREHRDWSAWSALSKTTIAQPNALTVGISNAGDAESVVLNALRDAALAGTDERLALFEWSAPDGCELDDRDAWRQAMPGLGRTITESAVISALTTDPPATFRTELLCQRVDALDAAIDPGAWAACADPSGNLASLRDRMVMCVDVAPDGRHVTLAGAALLDDGRIRVETFGAWSSTELARAGLSKALSAIRPRAVGWFPDSPAAVLGANLAVLNGDVIGRRDRASGEFYDYAPGVVEIVGRATAAACQSLADQAVNRTLLHPDDPLLNAHVSGSRRLRSGDGWRFARVGAGHCDAAYATAGAVQLARTLPANAPPIRSAIY